MALESAILADVPNHPQSYDNAIFEIADRLDKVNSLENRQQFKQILAEAVLVFVGSIKLMAISKHFDYQGVDLFYSVQKTITKLMSDDEVSFTLGQSLQLINDITWILKNLIIFYLQELTTDIQGSELISNNLSLSDGIDYPRKQVDENFAQAQEIISFLLRILSQEDPSIFVKLRSEQRDLAAIKLEFDKRITEKP